MDRQYLLGRGPNGLPVPVAVNADGYVRVVGGEGANTFEVTTTPYGYDISAGRVSGVAPWSKIGYVIIPATTETDIWSYGATTATVPLLSAAATLKVQTNNAADAGTSIFSGTATGGSATSLIDAAKNFTGGTPVAAGDCVILDAAGATPSWGFVTGVTGTTQVDVAWGFASGVVPAAGTTYSIVDYSNQAGAHAVLVSGLDFNYGPMREIVITGGAGPAYVQTTKPFLRVNAFRVIATGSGGKPTAAIALMDNGAVPATTYTYISAGFTRARNTMYTVPGGKTLYVTQWNAGYVGQSAAKYCRLYTRASQYSFESGGAGFRTRELTGVNIFYPYTEMVASSGSAAIVFQEPTRLLQTVDIKVSGYADAAGTVVSTLRGFLVDN